MTHIIYWMCVFIIARASCILLEKSKSVNREKKCCLCTESNTAIVIQNFVGLLNERNDKHNPFHRSSCSRACKLTVERHIIIGCKFHCGCCAKSVPR